MPGPSADPNDRLVLALIIAAPLAFVTLVTFVPRLRRGAVWRGTTVPISFLSRLVALVVAWISAFTILGILPPACWLVVIVGAILSFVMYWRDKRAAANERSRENARNRFPKAD